MKTTAKLFAIVAIVVAGVTAGSGWNFKSAEDAAVNCHTVQKCLAEGYWMESCVVQPYMYLLPPTGTYAWGEVKVEMRCDPSLGKPPMSLTCFVEAKEHQGVMKYRETHQNVLIPIR